MPLLAVPARFQVVSTVHELSVRWRWLTSADVAVFVMIVGLSLLMLMKPPSTAFAAVFIVVGIGVLVRVVMGIVNYTVVAVVGEEFSVHHAPLPWFGNHTIRIADLKQLYVEEIKRTNDDTTTTYYALCALVHNGHQMTLVPKLKTKAEAQYLEAIFERRLRIKDRRLVGEASK